MISTEVVMTPSKTGKVTHIKIERKKQRAVDPGDVVHVAGGEHQGLVVNRPGKHTDSQICWLVYL